MTECTQSSFEFHPLFSREVVARFDGGQITSDAGGLLLREVARRTGIVTRFAACFADHRSADRIEHSVAELVSQRVYGLALGYEDLNDHDQLRADSILAVLAGKRDPEGHDRRMERDQGKPLAGKSTLNRLELTKANVGQEERYCKIEMDTDAIDRLLVDIFLEAHATPPEEIVLDLDATDDPLYGHQEGRFFHGYYGHYCYLPLYIFCGEHLLCARLRSSNIDASAGSLDEVKRIVKQIRESWPEARIILRADSGFCRDEIMKWCEEAGNKVDYIFGLARNQRLRKLIDAEMVQAAAEHGKTNEAARVFTEFVYQTLDSWNCARRVIAKAEHLDKGGDRTSTAFLRSNQLRLYFSSIAYLLMHGLRRLGLQGTEMAKAQCATIRLKLLKIGAQISVSVRKVWVALASSYPYPALFASVYKQLRC